MYIEPHDLAKEFPDLSDVLHQLDLSDAGFHRLFAEYQALDGQIIRAEEDIEPMADEYLEPLKVRRVHLKDQLYMWLRGAKRKAN